MATVCVACAASAYGFLRGRPWGYRLGITLLLVNLTGELVNAVLGVEPRAIYGLPVVALLIWYLTTLRVRAYFFPPPIRPLA